ncbi:MAG: hypothetical protein C4K58_00030 [Flavobacteriaceae bacterium]|nr:MAG: hypothetical protein C4K58_00030 [Flavobacteriaceae bacterium]
MRQYKRNSKKQSHLNFDTGDMNALFLYARFQAGLGQDLMLKNYGEAMCSNRGGKQIGINGWYANGQAYVYLQGELGIRIKLWFVNKRLPIVKAGTAALLQAKGPNPYWARGYLSGNYNLLGGMVKGNFRFKLEFGEECKMEKESVFGGMKLITDLSPKKDENNVDIFAIPQATFAFKVDEPIVIPEDDGEHTYKIVIDKMVVLDEKGNEIKGKIEFAKAKDVANFVSTDILPPNQKMKFLVQVSFMEKKGGVFQVVTVDGKKAFEKEERYFTTGTAPTTIPLSNIQYAYPVVSQENYYTGETNKGTIQLKRGQDYLFDDPLWKTSIQFVGEENTLESAFVYNEGTNQITFTTPELSTEKQYTFSIVAKNSNSSATTDLTKQTKETVGGQNESEINVTTQTKNAQSVSKDADFERLSYTFRTSKYNTLEAKLSSINFNTLWGKINSDVIMLQNNMNADEAFDTAELVGTQYTDNKPLIEMTALMDDAFADKFEKLFYNSYPLDGMTLSRSAQAGEENYVGIPPTKALPIYSSYLQYLENEKYNPFLKRIFPYKYDLFHYYHADWYELISKAANRYVDAPQSARTAQVNNLLQSTFGVVPKGKYNVKAVYMIPGGDSGTEKQFSYTLK